MALEKPLGVQRTVWDEIKACVALPWYLAVNLPALLLMEWDDWRFTRRAKRRLIR